MGLLGREYNNKEGEKTISRAMFVTDGPINGVDEKVSEIVTFL